MTTDLGTSPEESHPSGFQRHQRRNDGSKACTNCARIKCRCITLEDVASCERCHRLGKTCIPSAPAQRRGPKRGAASRSARLEAKLDDLVSLLQERQVPAATNQDNNVNTGSELDNEVITRSPSLIATPSAGGDYSEVLSLLETKEALARFSEEMIMFTPYIYIPPDMTSAQLRLSYPFLWLNIMAAASKSAKTRKALSLQIRRSIIERVVAGGERNLDLLFGMLTFLNWIHLFPMDKQFAALASQLAVSLVWDLGLQVPPPEHPARSSSHVSTASTLFQSTKKERTVEEKRAVLGAFVVTSMLSQTLKSVDGFRWSPYLDEYLNDISQSSTVPQDKVLVRQVKMQLIVNQFRYSSWKINKTEIPMAWVDMLQVQLDEIVGGLNETGSTFGSESTLFGFYYYTTLIIREPITSKSSAFMNEPDLRRYEMYERCVNSIKKWLDMYFAMPLRMYTSVPCSAYSQLCYVVLFLHQITTTRDASWNLATGHEYMDSLETVNRIIHIFEQVKAESLAHAQDGGEDQALSLGIKKFQTLKSAWENELISAQHGGQGTSKESEMPHDLQALFPTDPLESFGFHFLPDIMGDASWQ